MIMVMVVGTTLGIILIGAGDIILIITHLTPGAGVDGTVAAAGMAADIIIIQDLYIIVVEDVDVRVTMDQVSATTAQVIDTELRVTADQVIVQQQEAEAVLLQM
jgi:hypothetical protein